MKHLWAQVGWSGSFQCQVCGLPWVRVIDPTNAHCEVRTQAEYDKAMAEMRERQKANWAKVGGEGSL